MPSFTLRRADKDDEPLAFRIFSTAMREYVERTWGWDEVRQRQGHRADFRPDLHSIVLVDGQAAGVISVEEHPGHLQLLKLYLLPAFCGQGLGSRLLLAVIAQGQAAGKPVHLRVLRANGPAQAFYAGHGFLVVDETPERIFMRHQAAN
ncbi:GNAT family N-acetyltransferase [Chromobacterium sp. ATCC 53434]|uniref:GNAT family N-acetyltransferase n=1 Tax=Chromobacterium sp. (strain ATCC 53434 / SC 14030) TaxID=2059672 RepID=UPI000C758B69|nr:GNAT family N-acetyltransferase [Chromobacterium sp. ATCC 53434]AUH51805.1 GNAT family N-acetyltransferase [Chromobacterium sp. ATCC 53434]